MLVFLIRDMVINVDQSTDQHDMIPSIAVRVVGGYCNLSSIGSGSKAQKLMPLEPTIRTVLYLQDRSKWPRRDQRVW